MVNVASTKYHIPNSSAGAAVQLNNKGCHLGNKGCHLPHCRDYCCCKSANIPSTSAFLPWVDAVRSVIAFNCIFVTRSSTGVHSCLYDGLFVQQQ